MAVSCSSDAESQTDLCLAGDSEALIVLGQGVGGAFQAYEDLEEVGLDVAPQGGFGVTVIIRTEGLTAGAGQTAAVQLNVEQDGALVGDFLEPGAALRCVGDEGGQVTGVVVGFDRDVYKTNDDLIQLNGQVVDLVVTVTDPDGVSATVKKAVTVKVGG